MYGIDTGLRSPMVFCKHCRKKVEDCPHFVEPLGAKAVAVTDEKVLSLAYDSRQRVMEIAFKNGQSWQLFGVPPSIYQEVRDSTISSFLKFIAQRYRAAPVRKATPLKPIEVPQSAPCTNCAASMRQGIRRESA